MGLNGRYPLTYPPFKRIYFRIPLGLQLADSVSWVDRPKAAAQLSTQELAVRPSPALNFRLL
jgi:hypothetical protein